jgi:hypothetical protein
MIKRILIATALGIVVFAHAASHNLRCPRRSKREQATARELLHRTIQSLALRRDSR